MFYELDTGGIEEFRETEKSVRNKRKMYGKIRSISKKAVVDLRVINDQVVW